MKGVAPIKSEYLLSTSAEVASTDTSSKATELTADQSTTEEAAKRPCEEPESNEQTVKPKKKRNRGQNKQREKFSNQRAAIDQRLCKAILCGTDCSYGDKCKFSHDVADFMSKKPADLPGPCYNFKQFGKCPYGFACRFARTHITECEGKFTNIVDDSVRAAGKSVNSLSKENLNLLRKRKYDFSKAAVATKDAQTLVDQIVKRNFQLNCVKKSGRGADVSEKSAEDVSGSVSDNNTAGGNVSAKADSTDENMSAGDSAIVNKDGLANEVKAASGGTSVNAIVTVSGDASATDNILANGTVESEIVKEPSVAPVDCEPAKAIGPCTNEDEFTVKPGEKKTIDFRNKLYLAPLTTVGNLPFRRVCKQYGADITCGEMALATKLLQGVASEWALIKRHSSEDLFGVQLCGAFADSMSRCTQLLTETCDLDFIDVNVGCPIDLIFDQGAGSALMRRTNRFHEIVHSMVQVSNIPITVKIRTGISETKNTAHTLIPKLRDWGVALTTLHGRSREQRYTKSANWSYIDECATVASPMPLFGGGDILSFEDYNEAIKTNVSGTMLARGALIKPWLFTEIKEQRHWDISSKERLDILRDFANYGLEHWGSDLQGVETTRRFMLEWLSFLHRYIPVGLLERLPQKINERPSPYFGRDDLETMMASPNSADWVKISEMLLGPVPDGFFFIPKHKANSYS